MTLKASTLGSVDMDAGEQRFLSEASFLVDSVGQVQVTAARFDTKKNIKRALKLASARFDVPWKPNFGGDHWELLSQSLSLRHRLTHPKSREDLYVTDAEIENHREAFLWFSKMFTEFLESLQRRYVGVEA
jgi:hypothetical protein